MDFKEKEEGLEIFNEEKKPKRKGKAKWIALIVVLLLLTNIGSFFIGNSVPTMYISGMGLRRAQAEKSLEGVKDISKFKKLYDIRELIYGLYDGPIDDEVLLEGAIKGMASSLNDPYTVFMNKKEFSDLMEKNEGNYVGLGIQVGVKDDNIVVILPFEGSPAQKAGIMPGDIIQKVNGMDVKGSDLEKAVALMKGKEKVEVKLTIFREKKGTFDVSVKRDTIKMITVKGEMIDNSIGYMQISMFDENTSKEFSNKLKELEGKGMKGLILDLRENPGGLLTTSVEVASNFIEKGKLIVSTKDKYGKEEKYNSIGGAAQGMPLVVLIDGYTASASEIVSGALRDYNAAVLIGEKTFGKGIVQKILDLKDGTGFKVTVSKYYTPKGENIHKIGIAPNIEVKYPEDLRDKPYERSKDPQFNKALDTIKEKVK